MSCRRYATTSASSAPARRAARSVSKAWSAIEIASPDDLVPVLLE